MCWVRRWIKHFLPSFLRQLREKIKQNLYGKLTRVVFFHEENALAHTSTVALAAVQKCGFQHFENSPHFHDFVPSSRYWKRSSLVIILPQMMVLWLLWTIFRWPKMALSTQKGSVCSMTAGLSVSIEEGNMLKNDCIWFSKTDSFYLRPRTYQSPFVLLTYYLLLTYYFLTYVTYYLFII